MSDNINASAIARLEKMESDFDIVFKVSPKLFVEDKSNFNNLKTSATKMIEQLREEALKEFKAKYGL